MNVDKNVIGGNFCSYRRLEQKYSFQIALDMKRYESVDLIKKFFDICMICEKEFV